MVLAAFTLLVQQTRNIYHRLAV